MFVYAFSRDALVAIGAAALIFATRAAEYGAVYVLFLLGTENTYGILGLSFCVLAVALIGAGWYRSGGFLLGLAPAVHPSLGAWTVPVCRAAPSPGISRDRATSCVRHWPGFSSAPPRRRSASSCSWRSSIRAATRGRIFHARDRGVHHVLGWASPAGGYHEHRRAAEFRRAGVAAIWLIALSSDLPRSSVFSVARRRSSPHSRASRSCSCRGFRPNKLPTALLVLMPGRVLNFNALTFVALVIGLLGHYRQALWSQAAASLFLFVGLHARRSQHAVGMVPATRRVLLKATCGRCGSWPPPPSALVVGAGCGQSGAGSIDPRRQRHLDAGRRDDATDSHERMCCRSRCSAGRPCRA